MPTEDELKELQLLLTWCNVQAEEAALQLLRGASKGYYGKEWRARSDAFTEVANEIESVLNNMKER